MITTSLNQLAGIVEGELQGSDCQIESVSTDTRTIGAGALFIALVGERFDAHDFCHDAEKNGATALLVERPLDIALPQLIVNDTRIALGLMAAWVHQQSNSKTLAITGSCGKTTVKEMVSSILANKGKVLFTAGNFNNDIGVPLTLLRSEVDDDYAVIELGANHIGEIAYTTHLVKPSVALVNNVAAAHLEGFGSLDGVKVAKGEIYQGLQAGDSAIVNLDSHGEEAWNEVLADKKLISFSIENDQADIYASDISLDQQGNATFNMHTPIGVQNISLAVVGRHNVANALAAAALAIQCDCSLDDIGKGLAKVENVKGRVEVKQLTDSLRLIDDSYNASMPAMKAAVDLLSTYSGTRWLILGYMAELGSETLALHQQLGDYAAPFKFEYVLTYGDDSKIISEVCGGLHFETHAELIRYIEQQLQQSSVQNHTVLVKGANSARMSLVAEALKEKHK